MSQLNYLHHSVLKRRTPPKPRGLSMMKLPDESRTMIESECLDIFTVMVNSGASLQRKLSAIYLSGMSAAKGVG